MPSSAKGNRTKVRERQRNNRYTDLRTDRFTQKTVLIFFVEMGPVGYPFGHVKDYYFLSCNSLIARYRINNRLPRSNLGRCVYHVLGVLEGMKVLRHQPWMPCLAGVVAAVLGFVLGSVPTAQAGCGDYVIMGNHHSQPVSQSDSPTKLPRTTDQQAPAPSRAPRPCSGPLCSQTPFVPPAPSSVSPQEEKEKALPSLPCGDQTDGIGYLVDDVLSYPLSPISSIFHPPRPSTSRPGL